MTIHAMKLDPDQFDSETLKLAAQLADDLSDHVCDQVQARMGNTSGDVAAQYWVGENQDVLIGLIARYVAYERDMGN